MKDSYKAFLLVVLFASIGSGGAVLAPPNNPPAQAPSSGVVIFDNGQALNAKTLVRPDKLSTVESTRRACAHIAAETAKRQVGDRAIQVEAGALSFPSGVPIGNCS